jgi:hypothetical protein
LVDISNRKKNIPGRLKMTYLPILATTINEEGFYYIPYTDISGYAISREGNIISNKSGTWKEHKKTYSEKTRYYNICFTTNKIDDNYKKGTRKNKQDTYTLHKLLYSTFVTGRNHLFDEVVDHIDNDRSNNSISNFQLLTRAANIKKDGGAGRKGLDSVLVLNIYNDYKSGIKPRNLYKTYSNITKKKINCIIYGINYNNITGLPLKPKKQTPYKKKAEFKAKITRIHQLSKKFENHFDRAIKKAQKAQKAHNKLIKASIASVPAPAFFGFKVNPNKPLIIITPSVRPKDFIKNNPAYYQFSEASKVYAIKYGIIPAKAVIRLMNKIEDKELDVVLIGKRYFILKDQVV